MRIRTREATEESTQAVEMSRSPGDHSFQNTVLMGLTHHRHATEAIHLSVAWEN